MSELVNTQEGVYDNLIREEDRVKKPPRYVSKFRPAVVVESKLNKDSKRTMGPAKVETTSPDKYLKKHSKEPRLPENGSKSVRSVHACTVRKPPVAVMADSSPVVTHTERYPEKTTAAVPVKPGPTSVDFRRRHKQLLENAGLVPKYIFKKDYGEVPAYLQKHKEERQKYQEECKRFEEEQKKQAAIPRMSDEERQAVLEGLKKTWGEVHDLYQKLPMIINTMSMKNHKIHLEEELGQLERNICLFERFTNIYISKS
ncbi:enkurin [Austrofundulus limnaeus]|uniref:Enkurin n=1 Tax=Austrofundulus limnaeus TaxID=52670 RepID=A0A2I4AZB0_AUSLI|nr:PREDICTED: enkurin [Austrofundulus limnaeus]